MRYMIMHKTNAHYEAGGKPPPELIQRVGGMVGELIAAGILKGGTDIPGTFYEALVSDDDDGDLDNGTPHLCDIYDAFGRHGLGLTANGEAVLTSHEQIIDAPADTDIPVEATLTPVAVGCVDATFDEGSVFWRAGEGEWQEEPLTSDGVSVKVSFLLFFR